MCKIVVVGGGAAGMMAAYTASTRCRNKNDKVILLERNEKLGKKIFITGKGRCNVTNACDVNDFFNSVVGNEKFLYSSVYGYDSSALMADLENYGCPLKIERGERVFPVSDHSSDIIRTLEKMLSGNKVEVWKNCYVNDLILEKDEKGESNLMDSCENRKCVIKGLRITVEENGKEKKKDYYCDAVILATGGKSYSSTGSDGNMHKHLEQYGHSIVPMHPGLVPLCIREDVCKELQGLSLKNVQVQLTNGKKVIYDGFGEMLFTHFGMSGPLILSAASYYNHAGSPKDALLTIDLKPALSEKKLDERLLREFENAKNKQWRNILPALLPGKLATIFPDIVGIPGQKLVNEITKEERAQIAGCLKEMKFHVTGTRNFEEAIITIGGVNVKQVNPSTMESKLIDNLYFAGEMLDLDALTGGFNLQIAWSTGHLAGESAAERVFDNTEM